MKKTFYLISLIALSSCMKERPYCGVVTEKYLLHKNNGGTHNIVFYSDSLKRNVNVSVTDNSYVNTVVGERVCYTLSDYQIGK